MIVIINFISQKSNFIQKGLSDIIITGSYLIYCNVKNNKNIIIISLTRDLFLKNVVLNILMATRWQVKRRENKSW